MFSSLVISGCFYGQTRLPTHTNYYGATNTEKRHLTRDEILEVRVLRDLGWTYEAIAAHMKITQFQVQYSVLRIYPTPEKRSGRPTVLRKDQEEELIEYICSSKHTRRQTYYSLSRQFPWGVGEGTIRSVLRRNGFNRRMALCKPPISETNRIKQLAFARDHLTGTDQLSAG